MERDDFMQTLLKRKLYTVFAVQTWLIVHLKAGNLIVINRDITYDKMVRKIK